MRPAAQRPPVARPRVPGRRARCAADRDGGPPDGPDRQVRRPRPELRARRGDVPPVPGRTRVRSPASWQELLRRLPRDPAAVDGHWRDYFAGVTPPPAHGRPRAAPAPRPRRRAALRRRAAPAPRRRRGRAPLVLDGDEPEPLRGAAARIVENMEASLGGPDRDVGARRAREAARGQPPDPEQPPRRARAAARSASRTSSRYAVAAGARRRCPAMNSGYGVVDGKPVVVRHEHVNLGLAVDVAEGATARARCSCPNIKDADTLDFAGFCAAYEELIREGPRRTSSSPDDFAGTTVHDHEPGHDRHRALGAAAHAGPGLHRRRRRDRLPGRVRGRRPADARPARRQQGRHAHEHLRPPHHPGRRERRVPRGGSTSCCSATTASTTTIFAELRRARTSRRAGARDRQPARRPDDAGREGRQRARAHQHVPGPRPPHRQPRPARPPRARTPTPSSTSTTTASRSGTSTASSRPAASAPAAAAQGHAAARHPRRAARRVRAHDRRRVHAHPGARPEGVDPGRRSRAPTPTRHRRTRSAGSSSG